MANTYTKKERNMYLTGLFGQNMIYNIAATGLVYYFQNVICLPAMAIGWIFAIARVWDAINDPMMGTIVDRTHSKWGKCRPYLLFAPIVICVITIATFLNSNYANATTERAKIFIIGWAALSYILWGMSFTAADIPLWGITALMTEDEKDRSTILALARIIASIGAGLVVAGIIPASQAVGSALEKSLGHKSQQYGFIIVAIILAIVGTVLFQMAGLFTKERVSQSEEHRTMKENFALMWKCLPFRQILISGVLRSPMQLITIVAMTLLSYYYGDGNMMNCLIQLVILGGGLFGGQFVASALIPAFIGKVEKKKLYNLSSGLSAIPYALMFVVYLLDPTGLNKPVWLFVLCILFLLSGLGMGAVNVLQSVMIADCIDYEEYNSGIRPDGVFFSGQSFITKLSSGIASLISSIVFSAVGYSGKNVDNLNKILGEGSIHFRDAYQSYSWAMFFLISIPPAIGVAVAVIPTLKYALPDKEHTRILNELNERRENAKNISDTTE